jgi:cytochrome P450
LGHVAGLLLAGVYTVPPPPPRQPELRRRSWWKQLSRTGQPLLAVQNLGLTVCDLDAAKAILADDKLWVHGQRDTTVLTVFARHGLIHAAVVQMLANSGKYRSAIAEHAAAVIAEVIPQGQADPRQMCLEFTGRAQWTVLGWPEEHREHLVAIWCNPNLATRPPADECVNACARVLRERADCELSEDEARHLVSLLTHAGVETTATALKRALRTLARNKVIRQALLDNPDRIGAFAHELLRVDPPLTTVTRRPLRDTTIAGYELRADMELQVPLATLNLESEIDIDLQRPRKSYTFGSGAFRCVGSALGRLMIEEFIREWLARIPEFSGEKTLAWAQ